MVLDGARSATRRELVGGTCATRVTRGTFDFQEGDGIELRDKEFARKFSGAFQARSSINLASKHLSGTERSRLL